MIELRRDELVFSFPEVHPHATLSIGFVRTLRIPDDGNDYPLPPGLEQFPLRHIDDLGQRVPTGWIKRGGVVFPMYQSEAVWLHFRPGHIADQGSYPFAIKVAAGKINAVTGAGWTNELRANPQDYMVAPEQPWLDGFCVEKGIIRQFVAMPLGAGYTAEEQITGAADFGGLQIIVYPMKREAFERNFPVDHRAFCREERLFSLNCCACPSMGLAPGGRMKQEIFEDPFAFADWDATISSRCFVHIANSMVWESITGSRPPTPPQTAATYAAAGLPWFDYYDDNLRPVDGSSILAKLKSVVTMGREKRDVPLPENQSVTPSNVVELRRGLRRDQVREAAF